MNKHESAIKKVVRIRIETNNKYPQFLLKQIKQLLINFIYISIHFLFICLIRCLSVKLQNFVINMRIYNVFCTYRFVFENVFVYNTFSLRFCRNMSKIFYKRDMFV